MKIFRMLITIAGLLLLWAAIAALLDLPKFILPSPGFSAADCKSGDPCLRDSTAARAVAGVWYCPESGDEPAHHIFSGNRRISGRP